MLCNICQLPALLRALMHRNTSMYYIVLYNLGGLRLEEGVGGELGRGEVRSTSRGTRGEQGYKGIPYLRVMASDCGGQNIKDLMS